MSHDDEKETSAPASGLETLVQTFKQLQLCLENSTKGGNVNIQQRGRNIQESGPNSGWNFNFQFGGENVQRRMTQENGKLRALKKLIEGSNDDYLQQIVLMAAQVLEPDPRTIRVGQGVSGRECATLILNYLGRLYVEEQQWNEKSMSAQRKSRAIENAMPGELEEILDDNFFEALVFLVSEGNRFAHQTNYKNINADENEFAEQIIDQNDEEVEGRVSDISEYTETVVVAFRKFLQWYKQHQCTVETEE